MSVDHLSVSFAIWVKLKLHIYDRQVHGVDIQPFGYQDRLDFIVSLDNAIDDINLDNIELLAVEEFLPASGPSAESLMNLFGNNAVFKSPKASSGNAPPPAGETCLSFPIMQENKVFLVNSESSCNAAFHVA